MYLKIIRLMYIIIKEGFLRGKVVNVYEKKLNLEIIVIVM